MHETHYARGPDGLIAYQVIGDGPRDLVYLTGATSHVDIRWESPYYARFQEQLASFSRLIVFDRRGVGASDPVTLEVLSTWEGWSEDLTTILDAVGSERAAILALVDGASLAIPFAATHPDRTSALILGNATARWRWAEDYPAGLPLDRAESILELISTGWGTEALASVSLPSLANDPKEKAWFAKYMRACASPTVAATLFRSVAAIDMRDVLPSIQAATLVIHRKGLEMIPVDQGRYLASHINGALLQEFSGADLNFNFSDSDEVLAVIEEFITGTRPALDSDRVLATVLFTDVVDSTRHAAERGDRAWRDLLERHREVVRRQLERHRGREVNTRGDDFLATFDGPARAIHCASAILQGSRALGVDVRAGLHTGEVELMGADVGGIAVHIGARVSELAGSGEILVSSTVKDLVAGSGIEFDDRGAHTLKGVPGEWRLFIVKI